MAGSNGSVLWRWNGEGCGGHSLLTEVSPFWVADDNCTLWKKIVSVHMGYLGVPNLQAPKVFGVGQMIYAKSIASGAFIWIALDSHRIHFWCLSPQVAQRVISSTAAPKLWPWKQSGGVDGGAVELTEATPFWTQTQIHSLWIHSLYRGPSNSARQASTAWGWKMLKDVERMVMRCHAWVFGLSKRRPMSSDVIWRFSVGWPSTQALGSMPDTKEVACQEHHVFLPMSNWKSCKLTLDVFWETQHLAWLKLVWIVATLLKSDGKNHEEPPNPILWSQGHTEQGLDALGWCFFLPSVDT